MNLNYPMGRELVQMNENEWWIVETHSQYHSRQSKPFTSKEEAIKTLIEGGCPKHIVDEFEKTHHVSSMFVTPSGQFIPLSQEISNALAKTDSLCPTGDCSLFDDEDFESEE